MSEVFLKLFNMSIAAGWLILAVIVLRLLLKKAPKWLSCILWAIVAIRLVCPVSFESSFSLIPSAETINPEVVRYAQEPTVDSGINMINNTLNPIIVKSFAPAPGSSANPLDILTFIAGIVWVIGLITMLGYAFASFLRIRSKVREAIPFQDNIWLCDAVKSPFILGIFKPQIYLSSSINNEQQRYVLAHEQAHIKRKDHWWKILAYLLLAVYWFHPLVWLSYILFCRDIELACDEKVIKDMDIEGKKAYSHALVSCSIQRKMVIACPLAFGEISIKERVKNILRYKKPAFLISIAAIAICAVTAICFLTNPKINSYDIKIVVPANSEADFYYSDYEISPNKNHVVLSAGEGLGDSEVTITPAAEQDGTNSERAYITPGLPIKMKAKQGAWFKVGVNMSNPTDEDITVYVHVKDVVVRVFDSAANEMYDRIPMVMVNGKLYYDTGTKSTKVNRSSNMDGRITSTVEDDNIVYDDSSEETWYADTWDGSTVYVKVQRSADKKHALASWKYDKYNFAILADIPEPEADDISPLSKTALSIIAGF